MPNIPSFFDDASVLKPIEDLQTYRSGNALNPFFKKEKVPESRVFDERYRQVIEIPKPIRKNVNFKKYKFHSFYHPYVCEMIKQLRRYGIEGLLNPTNETPEGQLLSRQLASGSTFDFAATYSPKLSNVDEDFPQEGFDFDESDPYGLYNWELFFHIPLMIANKLHQNQRFEEAQQWYHYIFDPTETDSSLPAPDRFWKVQPFFNHHGNESVDQILKVLQGGDKQFTRQLAQWTKNPFSPHAIARLRTVSYMKTTVMKYLDNLISWGDHLFRRDTIESINEATHLYILASQILGKKPNRISKDAATAPTLKDIVDQVGTSDDDFSQLESEMGEMDVSDKVDGDNSINAVNSLLFFGTPSNDKLLGYWDTVGDRLFKIRHCQNIEGIRRELALFAPPIDPGLLVKATAAGVEIGTVLDQVTAAAVPHYRFLFLLSKAQDFCNDVKNLGGALLSALEKKDAEELAQLRSGQEVQLLKAIRETRKKAVDEAEENLESLQLAKELTEIRREYYSSREYMNNHEKQQLKKLDRAMAFQLSSQVTNILAGALALLPTTTLGVAGAFGSPFANVSGGGKELYHSLQAASMALNFLGQIENHGATKASIKGGYDRRMEDWVFQTDLATKELDQIDKQIAAAEIRLAMAEKELQNHELQTEQSEEVAEFMQDKYTNKALYDWMVGQLSGLYFQSYQLAYDMARQAEAAYRRELGEEDAFFIEFGHWDSLKKGLLAGERLQHEIRRMEAAHLQRNERELELTKHVSLRLLNAAQLVNLRNNGWCEIQIPEVMFDLDHPGHYLRRIKSVSLTIPCVTGPYTNVSAKLTLLSNRYRKNSEIGSEGYGYQGLNDGRFKHNVVGVQSIATSTAQNDSGTFELNFRDERYLPFEGAGAISTWRLELPNEHRQFDYDTISDVVLHISYMAKDGGERLRTGAVGLINDGLNALSNEYVATGTALPSAFSLKMNFADAYYQLMQPINGQGHQQTQIALSQAHFPRFLSGKTMSLVNDAVVMVKYKDDSTVNNARITELAATLSTVSGSITGSQTNLAVEGDAAANAESLPLARFSVGVSNSPIDEWIIRIDDTNATADLASVFNSSEVEDVYLLLNYTVADPLP